MIIFKDELMQRITLNIEIYNEGLRMINSVTGFKYIKEKNIIEAIVKGEDPYNIEIEIGKNGSVNSYFCQCKDFQSNFGACKHIVAAMKYSNLYFSEYGKSGFLSSSNDGFLSLSELGIDFGRKRQKINLWIEQSIQIDKTSSSLYMQMQLKIGFDRPYIVKNIPEFLDSIANRRPQYFGRKFIFEPENMYFEGINNDILNFLVEVNKREIAERNFYSQDNNYHNLDYGIVRTNTVILIEDNLKKYIEITKNSEILTDFFGEESTPLEVTDDIEVYMDIREGKNSLLLEINYSNEEKIMPLTLDYELVLNLDNLKVYTIPSHKARFLGKIHQIRQSNKKPVFSINKKERKLFIEQFFKPYKDCFKVLVEPGISESMMPKELITRVYFDAFSKGISARIDFCYGDRIINAINEDTANNDYFYMRKYDQEEKIIDFLKAAGMYRIEGLLLLDEDEKIVDLLNGKIEELSELAEVYYSEEFKKIKIKAVTGIKVGIRLNTDSNLLEFDFELDGFDDSELSRLFHSIRQKKRYHRLKNGSILNLEDKDLINVSRLLEDLNINTEVLASTAISIPSNKALFIDNFVNEKNLKNFNRDDRFKNLIDDIIEPKNIEFSLDEDLDKVLREYQKFGLKWLKTLSVYGFGGILADDMGLGKTLQVLAFINEENKIFRRPCLVVAPTSLVYNWKSEAIKFVPNLKVEVIYGIKTDRNKALKTAAEADIIVTSYGSLKRDVDNYREIDFSYIFVDEAQHIKNPNTLNANTVKTLKAKACFALTGTPVENSLTELWSIFDFIMPGYLMNHSSFVKKFEKPIVHNNDKESMHTLSKLIKPFLLRRLKSEVLKELPEKIESLVVSDMTREQRKLYAAYMKQAQTEIAIEIKEKGIARSKIKILALLTRLRQICCHPSTFVEDYKGGSGKLETLLEIIGDSVDSGHRLLLFSQFTRMHDIISKELDKLGIEYFYLDGATKAKERINMTELFNQGEKSLFLISLKAGGTGLNLTGADMVIHYDPWWNPAVEDQATDRAYRIGQTKAVQVFKIITKGSIEEKIYELQQRKRGLINRIIEPGENLLTRLGEDEIRELFQ